MSASDKAGDAHTAPETPEKPKITPYSPEYSQGYRAGFLKGWDGFKRLVDRGEYQIEEQKK